ncbi:MAG TPA: oligosaccharide flippase family protein [Ignavibacteriaceae bacterium]|nr:oligosaccharide flippase family protein [Ignavibacteriaceae bacterium]
MLEILENLYIKYYKDSIVLKRFTKVFTLDILVRASNFILLPVYLKLMSKEEFGLYTYLYSFIWILSLILNFGLYVAQTKLYHDYDNENRKELLFSIYSSLTILIIFLLVPIYIFNIDYNIIGILFKNKINYQPLRFYLALSLIVSIYTFMLSNYFVTTEKIKNLQLFNASKLLFVHGITLTFLYLNPLSDKVLLRLQYSYLVEGLIVLIFSYSLFNNFIFKINLNFIKKAFKISLPAMVTSILGLLYNFTDKFILEKYSGFSNIAVYNLAFTIASILIVIFYSFQSVYLPFFFKEKDVIKNFQKTKNILIKMGIIFVIISILIIVMVKVGLIFNILDKKYNDIMIILPILLVAQILQSMVQLFNNYIIYFEIVYVGTLIGFGLSFVYIGLNLLLIPQFNIIGASVTTLIIYLLSLIIYYIYFKKNQAYLVNSKN